MLILSLVASTILGGTGYAHASTEHGIPPWARKYNMNCSGCHYPSPPRLNATGLMFRWAGYRMPEEIGEDQEMDRVSNYLGTRARFQYVYEKPSGEPATTSAFSLPDATVFYAGSYGRNFGGFFELAKEEDETEFGAQVIAVWGKERSHGGVRAGQTHMLLNAGVAGFDRPVGINAPTPVAGPVTAAIPFSFAGDQAGLEAFYVTGSNRISGQLFNGISLGEEGETTRKKDFVVTDQLLLDSKGSGVIGTAYYGTVSGLAADQEDLNSHFWRVGLSANKIVSDFEALGGLVFGKDIDLPVGGLSGFTTPSNKGVGYWFSGQYYFGGGKGPPLTLFARYEFVDPDTDIGGDANRRYVLGSVLPVTLPEYLRLAAEYWMDDPQGDGAPRQNNVAVEFMLSY